MEHEKDGTFQSNVCEIMAICSQSGFDLCTPARRAGRANYYYFCMDSINYMYTTKRQICPMFRSFLRWKWSNTFFNVYLFQFQSWYF